MPILSRWFWDLVHFRNLGGYQRFVGRLVEILASFTAHRRCSRGGRDERNTQGEACRKLLAKDDHYGREVEREGRCRLDEEGRVDRSVEQDSPAAWIEDE